MSDGLWIGLGIAVAGIAVAVGCASALGALAVTLSAALTRALEAVEMAVREHADGQADAATTSAHATVRAAKIAAGLFKRPVEAPKEPTREEALVADFMASSGKMLTEEEMLAVEWAYGRLDGKDKDEGSFEDAVKILRRHGAPIPEELRPMLARSDA